MPVYKDEKRNSWFCTFYYKDWQGNRKKKKKEGFKLKREAQDYERDFIKQQAGTCDMTFKSLCDIYKEDCKTRLKPTTYSNKENMIDNLVLPFFENIPINQITPTHIRQWQNNIIDKQYTQTYMKTVNAQLSAILNYAVKYYGLPQNPVRICGNIGKMQSDKLNFWTLDEYKAFISKVEKKHFRTAYELLFWTGMRSGEMFALTLRDFNMKNLTVTINKNYARHNGNDLILTPKTDSSKREIYIPQHIADSITEYTERKYDISPDDRLFDFSKQILAYNMKKVCKLANVKQIRLHDLRHSHASLLIELGYSPLLISERLGHENIETTLKVYSHLYPNKQRDLVDELQKLCN